LAMPAQATQRAYVASYGNDASAGTGCLLTSPCRSFTAAHSVVDPGGEIVALDAAGYGSLVITKSVSVIANPGYFAGIAASTGNAIVIGTAGVSVTLRGLNINGIGGTNGVSMSAGNLLTVENCVISNFPAGSGITMTTGTLRLVNSVIRNNGNGIRLSGEVDAAIASSSFMGHPGAGVLNENTVGGTTSRANITNSVFANNNVGVYTLATLIDNVAFTSVGKSAVMSNNYGIATEGATGSANVSVGDNQVTGNYEVGLYQSGTTVLESIGNNHVRQNGANTFGVITPAAPI